MTSRVRLLPLGAVFVVSGAAALVYQVAWMRHLTLLFGATVYAVSTVLACFMGGLALGAYVGGVLASRIERPGRAYAMMELAIGGLGAISIPVFQGLPAVVGLLLPRDTSGPLDIAVRFLLAVPILLLPTALMGATLPVLIRGVAEDDATAARAAGLLYACNTFGACLGAAAAGYVLVPLLGLSGAISVAVMLNVAAALVAARVAPQRVPITAPASKATEPGPPLSPAWLAFAALSGLVALAVEVLWTRALVLYLGSSVYAYASMLTVYLLGLGLGGALGVRLLRSSLGPAAILAAVQLAIAFDLPLLVWQFGRLSAHLSHLQQLLGSPTYAGFAIASFVAVSEMLLPPTLLMGICFPVLMAAVTRRAEAAPRAVGTLYAANTVGAISGAILAPVLLIPALGIQRSLLFLAAANLVLFAMALGEHPAWRRGRAVGIGAGVALVFGATYALLCPRDAVVRSAGVFDRDQHRRLVQIDEDVDATVTIELMGPEIDGEPGPGGWYSLSVNGVNVAGTSPDLVAIQKLQGHLPMLLAAARRDVLHIGFGSGGTARAVACHPIRELVIAEISMGVIRTSNRYLRSINGGVLDDPRVRVVHKDGRNYLLAKGAPFDVILSDSVHPRYSGNGALYTEEYYRRCKAQLRPGGVVSQWLPIYSLTPSNFRSILKAFTNVFPETSVWYVNSTVNPFTIVIGHNGPFAIDVDELGRRMAERAVGEDLRGAGVRDPIDLLDYFVMAGKDVVAYADGAEPHRDDLPAVEYESMLVMNRDATWYQILRDLVAVRAPVAPHLSGDGAAAMEGALNTAFAATGRALEGHLLVILGRVDEAREVFREAHEMNPRDQDPQAW